MFPLTTHPHLFHAVCEALALSGGTYYYRWLQQRAGVPVSALLNGSRFAVLLGCIFGAAIGNKIMFWIEVPHLLPLFWNRLDIWFAGQSMVGGLLGGLIGVELAKKISGVHNSTGDAFVFPILLGLMIGRVGCFVAGLDDGTYGLPTTLPWGIDFGDGIPRHPTQLYEIAFAAILWMVLNRTKSVWANHPGLCFKVMLSSYLLWRLWVDGLKPVPFDYGLGWSVIPLSGIQVACAIALMFYLPLGIVQWQKSRVAS